MKKTMQWIADHAVGCTLAFIVGLLLFDARPHPPMPDHTEALVGLQEQVMTLGEQIDELRGAIADLEINLDVVGTADPPEHH